MSGYIGINNKAKKIKSLYIGVNNKARKVNSAYIGVNGVAKQWYPGIDTSNPNFRYNPKNLGVWNNISDVDNFCNAYNHDNNYTGIGLGDYVTINDGTYNVRWEIVGFDQEYNQTAADGTTYDNGYGIMFSSMPILAGQKWQTYNTYGNTYNNYKNSDIHKLLNGSMYQKLYSICQSHIIKRNVLLTYSTSIVSASQWTTAYITLPSIATITGSKDTGDDYYHDYGEASYEAALYKNFGTTKSGETYSSSTTTDIWTRNRYDPYGSHIGCIRTLTRGYSGSGSDRYYYDTLTPATDSRRRSAGTEYSDVYYRPFMYIR